MTAGPGSFFHLQGVDLTDQPCQGTACFVAAHRGRQPGSVVGGPTAPRVYCLGRCYQAPAAASDSGRPHVEVHAPAAVVLARVGAARAPTLAAAREAGGYRALEQALATAPDVLVAMVKASGLRGRGGAGFPTGRKWQTVARAGEQAGVAYVVANADEGDPGAYIDRFVLEDDPHAVIEGMAIAAVAIGAQRGFAYIRKEYPAAQAAFELALVEARSAGVLGPALLGGGPPFDVEIVRGEGSYVCGEETALLNALEGRRPEVRARPPYPAARGLYGSPTLVNNVETLAAIPWIVTHGAAAYAAMGTTTSRGTKAVSLNSLFRRPGLYEVELGIPVRDIVDGLGGGLADGDVRGVLIGGPLAGILPPHLLDTPLAFDELRAVGCEVGHGGVVAFDEHTTISELVRHVVAFAAYESCGKCTPCRLGAPRLEAIFDAVHDGLPVPDGTAAAWGATVAALAATSLCGHGTGLAAFAQSVMTHYGEDLDRCLG